jgi:parallel beta-helix repeat protein
MQRFRRPLSLSVALLLMAVTVALLLTKPGARPVRAATLCVAPGGAGGCFATINAALAAAAPGDTINVAAGVYNEQVNVTKAGLSLRGARAGTSACARSGTSGESIIANQNGPLQLTADNVSVDGFVLQGASQQANAGITTSASHSGHRILNNIIQDNVQGIYLNSSGANPTTVQGNSFKNNSVSGAGSGNGIYSDAGLKNVEISFNCFSGHSNASIVIVGAPDKQMNIGVLNNQATGEQLLELLFVKNALVKGNRASIAPAAAHAVISVGGADDGITIEGNTLSANNTRAIRVSDLYTVGVNTNVTLSCNRVSGAFGGLIVEPNSYTGALNAENNWWGCNAGPNQSGCATVTASVDFTPWLLLSLNAPSSASKDAPTTLSANLNRNSAGAAAPCNVPDATPISFASDCGAFNPATALTSLGSATTSFTANRLGSCNVQASLDNQTLSATLTVVDGAVVTITDPAGCTGQGDTLTVTVRLANSAATPQNASFTATLPPQLRALPGCSANVGACTAESVSSVTFAGTLSAGQTATATFTAQVSDEVITGDDLCLAVASNLGGVMATTTGCIKVTCDVAGPGRALNPALSGGAHRPGSVLVYNLYTSAAATPNSQNTRVSLTNTSVSSAANVRLYFVSQDCAVAETSLCLTANQTATFQASDVDPGVTGYLVAVAVNRQTGCPISFNYLIGDEHVKMASGHQANLGAEAISALSDTPAICASGAQTAELRFDGVRYGLLPATLALDSVQSRADGNNTLWVLNRLDGNLATGVFAQAVMTGMLYDDLEQGYSTGNTSLGCQLSGQIFPTRFPSSQRFETVVQAGHTGWGKLWLSGAGAPPGLLGAQINFNGNARASSNAYNQGHLLHKLSLTDATVLTIPLAVPGC